MSRSASVFSYIVFDLFGSIFYFPVWWYTHGLLACLRWIGRALVYRWKAYAMAIWLKNFFVPMYGQYDWGGRMVSIFVRFFVLFGRFIAFVMEALIYFIALLMWIAAPPACLFLFVFSLYRGFLIAG